MCSGRRSATLPRQRGAVSARAQGLGQVWHARGTVQCAVEVDPLREERATGVLDGCLFTRRLRWHAVRAAAGLHKVGVHPVDGVRTRLALRAPPRPGRGRQFQRTRKLWSLGDRSVREQQWTRHTRRDVPSGDFIPSLLTYLLTLPASFLGATIQLSHDTS